jgi:hypothetical protein
MSATTQWLFKGTVIYTRFSDEVSLQDISENGQTLMNLLTENPSSGRVSIIIDASEVIHYPRNIKALRNAINPAVFSRVGWLLLVSDDFFHQHISQIFARLFQVRFHTSSNLRDAYHFLQVQTAVPPPQEWPDGVGDTMPTRYL